MRLAVARQHRQVRLALGVHLIDEALVRVDERDELRQQQLADGDQIALPLQHVREAREVRFQPVLLGVPVGGEPKVVDHRVDVVFQLRDFTARLDLDRPGQVSLGHGSGDLGDRSDLRRQIGGQQVDVAGEILPGARGARHVRLAAQPALHADLSRDVRHLIGKGRQRAGHVVDGFRERRDFAFGLDAQALLEVAVGHRGHDFHDAPHLLGEVGGHDVDVVGEILPGARRRPAPAPGRPGCRRCPLPAPRGSLRRQTRSADRPSC